MNMHFFLILEVEKMKSECLFVPTRHIELVKACSGLGQTEISAVHGIMPKVWPMIIPMPIGHA